MSFEPREYLRHILAESDYLVDRCRGLSPEAFEADETLRRAFVRSLEVIGEAAKKLPLTRSRSSVAKLRNFSWLGRSLIGLPSTRCAGAARLKAESHAR